MILRTILVVTVSASFLACSTGTKSRIEEHSAAFAKYTPEAQAQIQSGRIDLGFTEEMVYLALGTPREKTTVVRRDSRGEHRVTAWKYPIRFGSTPDATAGSRATGPETGSLSGGYGFPSAKSPGAAPPAPMSPRFERQLGIVEFENGKVTRFDPLVTN